MKKNPLTFSSLLRTSSISPTRLFNLASLVSMSANPLIPVLLFLSIMLINSSFAWTTTESHVSDQSAQKIKDLSLTCKFSEANTTLILTLKLPWVTKTEFLFTISIQYQYKQASGENKEKYQLGDYQLVQYQILQTNIIRIVSQTIRRITTVYKIEILEAKGLRRVKYSP